MSIFDPGEPNPLGSPGPTFRDHCPDQLFYTPFFVGSLLPGTWLKQEILTSRLKKLVCNLPESPRGQSFLSQFLSHETETQRIPTKNSG